MLDNILNFISDKVSDEYIKNMKITPYTDIYII